MIQLPHKTQSYGEILITAYHVMMASFRKTLMLYLFLFISSFLFEVTLIFMHLSRKENNPSMIFIEGIILILLYFINYSIIGGVIYRILGLIKNADPGLYNSLTYGYKKAVPLFVVALLYGLAIFIGLILLIVPGIMVSIYLVFSIYLIYFDFGIIDSMKESYRLVKDQWWRTLLNITIGSFVIFLAAILLIILVGLLGLGVQPTLVTLNPVYIWIFKGFTMLIFALFLILASNFSIAFMLTCIHDLKIRKEISGLNSFG